jgi:hypothetical protein
MNLYKYFSTLAIITVLIALLITFYVVLNDWIETEKHNPKHIIYKCCDYEIYELYGVRYMEQHTWGLPTTRLDSCYNGGAR